MYILAHRWAVRTIQSPARPTNLSSPRPSLIGLAQEVLYNVVELYGVFNLGHVRCVLYHLQSSFRPKKSAITRSQYIYIYRFQCN